MKALKKISYSPDVDILMIQLSDKKVDDAFDSGDMIVHVDKNKEPVLLEIFNGKKHLQEIEKDIQEIKHQSQLTQPVSVAHKIK